MKSIVESSNRSPIAMASCCGVALWVTAQMAGGAVLTLPDGTPRLGSGRVDSGSMSQASQDPWRLASGSRTESGGSVDESIDADGAPDLDGLRGDTSLMRGVFDREMAGMALAHSSRSVLGDLLTAAADWVMPEGVLGDGGGVVLDLGTSSPIQLQPGTAGQTVPLYIRNAGAGFEVGGLDLKFGITGSGGSLPAITGVDLRAGTTFTTGNSVQAPDSANLPQLQYWSVSINDPFSPPSLPGGGAATLIGRLTVSTVGVTAGSWSLTFYTPETALLGPFGDTLDLTLSGGTLTAVPEAEHVMAITGVLLGMWAVWRRR